MSAPMIGLAYDYTTSQLFGIAYDATTFSSLYKIDVNTGQSSLIGESSKRVLINLACDTLGNLYSVSISSDSLYALDKLTGASTGIGTLGFAPYYLQGMTFDRATNVCYMAAYNNTTQQGELRTCDVTSGMTTLIGAFADKCELIAFAIPFNNSNTLDVAVNSINTRNIIAPDTISPVASFYNQGNAATVNVTMSITLDGSDTASYVSTKLISDMLPYTYTQIAFDPWKPAVGNYTITVYTTLNNDVNPENDTLRKAISVQNLIKVYCNVAYDPTGKLPVGPAYTYLQTPGQVYSLAAQPNSSLIAGGSWSPDNIWYGSVYADGTLISIDTITGARNVIGSATEGMLGLTYDYTNAAIYSINFDGSTYSYLYKIDKSTGKTTLIGKSGKGVFATLACDTLGNLYSLNLTDNSLYSLNKFTGVGTKIDTIDFPAGYMQGMDFDHYTNTCYMAAYNAKTGIGELRILDVKKCTTTLIGAFADGAEITGFAIPYHVAPKIYDAAVISINNPSTSIIPLSSDIIPQAYIMNKGKASAVTATIIITNDTSKIIYHSMRIATDLQPDDGLLIYFDSWSPSIGNYTITVYTSEDGDANHSNDTLRQPVSVRNLNKAFCYVNFDSTGLLPAGPALTYLQAPLLVNSIAKQTSVPIVNIGTWGGDHKWLGLIHNPYPDPDPNQLVSIDTITGARTVLCTLDRLITGIAFDYKLNVLYGLSNNGNEASLYKISMATGITSLVVNCSSGPFINLAIDKTGNLYAINSANSNLYIIYKNTGHCATFGNIGINASYVHDFEIDQQTNIAYLSVYNSDSLYGELRTISLVYGTTSYIGAFAGRHSVELTGFAIPVNKHIPLTDVGITSSSSPESGCGLGNENVSVVVENTGSQTVSNIPVHYTVDGGAPVDSIIYVTLTPGSYVNYTFLKKADLSAAGKHIITVFTTLQGDTLTSNDTLSIRVNNIAAANIPFTCNFEPPQTGWTITDFNNDGFTWYISPSGGYNTSYCAEINDNPAENSDDFLFTQCIYLYKFKTYQLSFYYKCGNAANPEALDAMLYNEPVVTGEVSLITDLHVITNTDYSMALTDFTVPATGVYYIAFRCYSWEGSKLFLDDINISDVTAITEHYAQNIEHIIIYPNPANDVINIESSENIKSLNLINILGQTVLSSVPNTLSTTHYALSTVNLAEGVYFIKAITQSGIITKKILISR